MRELTIATAVNMNWLIRQRATYCSPAKRNKPHEGGMTAKERTEYNNETGGNVQGPQPEGGPRKDSYCARSAGIKKCADPDKNGDCPNDIARRNWNC